MKYLKRIIELISFSIVCYILVKVWDSRITILSVFNIEKLMTIFAIVIVFLIIHVIRMFRIYILLVEEKMKIREFIKIYLKTTFVNNLIPFKLGEFYKMICYGEKLNSFSAGVSLVWIDRFFDSVILLILISIASGFDILSPVCIILVAFIVFSILAYMSFENTYKYFNTLVLERGRSKRSKIYLEGIEELKELYKKAKNMLSYRGATMIGVSILIWAFEYILAYLTLQLLFNMQFGLKIFTDYINGVFMLFNNKYTSIFYFNIILMMIIFTLITMYLKFQGKGVKNEQ